MKNDYDYIYDEKGLSTNPLIREQQIYIREKKVKATKALSSTPDKKTVTDEEIRRHRAKIYKVRKVVRHLSLFKTVAPIEKERLDTYRTELDVLEKELMDMLSVRREG